MVINTIRAIILTIARIIIIIVIGYGKENIIFVVKKFIALTNIWMINSQKQKSFKNKIKISAKININITHFWLIMKRIKIMIGI